jgi:hypothetical protein
MRRVLAVVVVLIVGGVAGPLATPAASATAESQGAPETDHSVAQSTLGGDRSMVGTSAETTQSATDTPTVQKDVRLFLTPDQPGAVDVSVTYDVPEELTSLTVSLPGDANDVRSSSFTEGEDGYEWDETTDPASIRFTMPANESLDGSRSVNGSGLAAQASANESAHVYERSRSLTRGQEGQYAFVDTGDWALVSVPQLGTGWGWQGTERVTLTESVSVDGAGSTGGEIAYLGPVETYTRTANEQQFTLVVPAAASMRESPGQVLDALAGASQRLRVGTRDPRVWFVAAPTGVGWGAQGIEYGGSDSWVLADASLEDPGNVWFHEYVHTRQEFQPATSGRWTVEASAEYYSALLSLRGGYVSFEEFETFLEHGEREPWRNAVLADPSTWDRGGNYVKGALVMGVVDRQIRLATDSSATMADVLWRLNRQDGTVTNGDVLIAVATVSSEDVAGIAERFTESRDAPQMWTRPQHKAAFDTQPPRMEYEVESYRVTGPFRNESYASLPTLYVGETLTLEALVRNDGGATGTYTATLTRDGDSVASAGGELAPSESTVLSVRHQFETGGDYNLSVGRTPVPLTVVEPATVTVESISVSDSTVEAGDTVTVTVELSNPSDRPATGPVPVTLDGEQVESVDVALDPGKTATRTLTVTAQSSASAVLAAGNKSVTLNPGAGSGGPIPGFGAAAALLAVAIATVVVARER